MKPMSLVIVVVAIGASSLVQTDSSQRHVIVPVQRGADGRPVPCAQDPACHNRIHPAIPARALAYPGATVVFETRDALDNQIGRHSTLADLPGISVDRVHPLTGPVHVEGAMPGDVLAVTIQAVEPGPDRFGWTLATGLLGFLRDLVTVPALARWDLHPGGATTPDIAGVRIPRQAFPGVVTTAPGPDLFTSILNRELALLFEAFGYAPPPEANDGVPAAVCAGEPCLRTFAAREHGGNFDVKALVPGVTLLLPCYVPGCLLSIGDVHYAQGDGEVAGSAIEMNAVVKVQVDLRRGQAATLNDRPAFEGAPPFPGGVATGGRYYATMGFPLKEAGEVLPQHRGIVPDGSLSYINVHGLEPLTNLSEDVTLAARDALNQMIRYLMTTRGMTWEQAYLLASVAVDVRIGNLVDVPNVTAYAVLPLDIFTR